MTAALTKELAVATEALEKALVIARGRFLGTLTTSVKDPTGDLVSDVDLLCETEISNIISQAFPLHGVVREETPETHSDSPWQWIVDPLDGTNNYVYGLPMWGVAITLCHGGSPVLAAIADGYSGQITSAARGGGVIIDGRLWTPPGSDARFMSSAFWVGYGRDRSSPSTDLILRTLYRHSRRVFENWAPTVDVGLYLRGGIDVVVGQDCSGTELPAALLTLSEAGACIVDAQRRAVDLSRIPPIFIAGRSWAVDEVCSRLDEPSAGL
ncbi:MAG: inositol monophosphatase family protein [Streptosporangiaceae bacterium]